ncbi:MAG: carbonic anhydrase [Candidatus Dependentiae bacterium]
MSKQILKFFLLLVIPSINFAATIKENIKIKYDTEEPVKPTDVKPQEALRRLKEGNIQYQRGGRICMEFDRNRGGAQSPFAAVVSCADSRVTPEAIFYVQSGQLFVTRVAGNVTNAELIGSLQFAALAFRTPLIVVLGHENCGAVDAALANKPQPGDIQSVINAIRPAVASINPTNPNAKQQAIAANVRNQVNKLRNNPLLKELIQEGRLLIVGGVYNFGNGAVTWIE